MYIVTGGAGFIGSNLVKMMIAAGYEDIIVVDDLTDGHKFVNIADLDIADYLDSAELLQRLESDSGFVRSIDAMLHQGACSTTTEWDGRYMMNNNYSFSKRLLHACIEDDIPFLYASSAAVYGASPEFAERPENEKPLNVYGYSKLQFDRYVRRLKPDSQVVGLRYFNVYGPREQHKGEMASVAYKLTQQLRSGDRVTLFAGETILDYYLGWL